MDAANKPFPSDDEEDLEALRLAALQTLKKNAVSGPPSLSGQRAAPVGSWNDPELGFRAGNKLHGGFPNKRGRFYGGRGIKNGQFHSGRVVSSNLISLTPSVSREDMKPKYEEKVNTESVLLLPQDRYINKSLNETKPDGKSSKFDRYKDSDKSEEEDSEDEMLKSDSDEDSPLKLERSDSLEALMQELDDEIQGRSTAKDTEEKPSKVKPKSKRKKEASKMETNKGEEEKEAKTETLALSQEKLKEHDDNDGKKKEENSLAKEVGSPDKDKASDKAVSSKNNADDIIQNRERSPENEPQLKKRRHSPPIQRDFRVYRGKPRNFKRSPPLHRPPFLPGTGPLPFPPNNPPPMFNNPPFVPPNCMLNPPPFYERPLSPLLINAETLQTQTMAPLSPRSAAFVLENRAIIEKRKRSPRRSYSRSPSPRRRSPSPRRSLSPPRRRSMSPRKRSLSPRKRSLSPRKRSLSPLRKRSRSPKMRRSMSPKRRSTSPKRRNFSPTKRPLSPNKRRSPSPKRRSLSPRRRDRKEPTENLSKSKPSVRDRLGFKSSSKPEEKDNKEKPQSLELSPQTEDKPLDPILEARKKKFEAKEIKVREGVIRLKPKDEVKAEKTETETSQAENSKEMEVVRGAAQEDKSEELKSEIEKEVLDEDALLQDDELDLGAQVDLFSDEESGSENEGRFKAKQLIGDKPTVLPLSKLVNGTKKQIKTKRSSENKEKKVRTRSRSPIHRNREIVDRKPVDNKPSPDSPSKTRHAKPENASTRKKLGVKSERHPKKFERKIEIKIKNPAKYERPEKVEGGEKESRPEKEKGSRKVELGIVASRGRDEEEDDETEIVVENEEDEVENNVSEEGDLRAQLSKKRAEKLQKITSHKGVTSRLLQNALENALPIKKSKKSKSKELSSSDGKLPIHLRLGLACSSDIFTKPKRKSKKRKTVESEDQV